MSKILSIRILNKVVTEEGKITPGSLGLEDKVIKEEPVLIDDGEYPAIFQDHPISDEEFEDAISVIVTHAMQRQLHTVTVDLNVHNKIIEERNKPLRISLEELSAMFGGREIVIVGSKSETGCTDDKNEKPVGCGIDG